jgi:hypothetical protein
MSAFEEDLFEDLAYDEAEGSAELYDDDGFDALDELDEDTALFDEADGFDELDAFGGDDFDALDELDAYDDSGDGFEAMYADEFDGYEAYDDFEAAAFENLLDNVLAEALDAEDEDEFFKKLWRGLKKVGRGVARVARKAAPVVGRIARVAAPVLSSIPTPWTQAAGMAASLLGQLRAEGATEDEALEAFAELAAKQPAALPVLAGLTARKVLKGAGKRMSPAARKRAVKDAKAAAKMLIKKRGPAAVRAMPKIAAAVRKEAVAKRTPPADRTKVVKRAAAKVARSPAMLNKLARPSAKAKQLVREAAAGAGGKTRTLTLKGPARITIAPL